jgi:hypothetical protein
MYLGVAHKLVSMEHFTLSTVEPSCCDDCLCYTHPLLFMRNITALHIGSASSLENAMAVGSSTGTPLRERTFGNSCTYLLREHASIHSNDLVRHVPRLDHPRNRISNLIRRPETTDGDF